MDASGESGPPDEDFRERRLRAIRDALGGFSTAERDVILRYYLRGEDIETITGGTGMTPPDLRVLLRNAKRRFHMYTTEPGCA